MVEQLKYLPIWLYDQEPLFNDALAIFRTRFLKFADPDDLDIPYIVEQASVGQIHAVVFPTTAFPIWCHSEYHGQAIDDLKAHHYFPCYYWYHAFIGRDWFRHYQHWPDLQPLDKSHASDRFVMYCRDVTGTRNYRTKVKQNLSQWRNMIRHDWAGRKIVSSEHSAVVDSDDAGAAIHLVLETLFDSDKLYLTEKVFKPMVMSQPFLIWGAPGTLSYLRRYGFKTFEGVWSEAYDEEKDPQARMMMLQELVDRLANMDQDQFSDLYQRCLPIVTHNREWFYSHEFMDLCWRELQTNFANAIENRDQLIQQNPGGQFCLTINQYPELLRLPTRRAVFKHYLAQLDTNARNDLLRRYPNISV